MTVTKMMDDEGRNKVRKKLIKVFAKKPHDLVRILEMLDKEQEQFDDMPGGGTVDGIQPPMWTSLRDTLKTKKFKKCAQAILLDSKTEWNNDDIVRTMRRTRFQLSSAELENAQCKPPESAMVAVADNKVAEAGVGNRSGLVKAWDLIPTKYKGRVLISLHNIPISAVGIAVGGAVGHAVIRLGGIGLSAVHLTWSCWYYIRKWFNGEITGKRCAKKCVDTTGSIGAGVGGAAAGAVVGSAVIPVPIVGTFVGGLLGAAVAELGAKELLSRITRNLFDLPKTTALEKAYNYLEVHHEAPNDELNSKFRKKCLEYHPDKGGDITKFHELQYNMSVIKMSRGE